MDSDCSNDGDDHHDESQRRDWENRQNSDVSDDENFSRGAKSIDSPPESPPRGGGNLDSPPASPAQGARSPHSVYSGSRRSSVSGSEASGDFPRSPDSPQPKSPESPDHEDSQRGPNRRLSDSFENQGRSAECSPNRSHSVTPQRNEEYNDQRSESPSPQKRSPCDNKFASPESFDDQQMGRGSEPASPDNRHPERDDKTPSPPHRYHERSPRPQHRGGSSSPILSPRNRTPEHEPGSSSPQGHQRNSRSSSPYRRDASSPLSDRVGGSVNNQLDWERSRSPSDTGTLAKNTSPRDRRRYDSSSSGSPSPRRSTRMRQDHIRSPDRRGVSHSPEDNTSRASGRKNRSELDDDRHHSYGRRTPDSDGRSNISSNSSIGSPVSRRSRGSEPKHERRTPKIDIKSHGEDLSDVSDVESIGSIHAEERKTKEPKKNEKEEKEKKNGMNMDEAEQLDFEAEESDSPLKKPNKEKEKEKEKVAAVEKSEGEESGEEVDGDEEEGEVKELEEGELSDEGEVRPEETEPRPVCRFFSRGQCTWGSSCRFVHPGVTDKGNYTMFDMVRPLVPMNAGPLPPHMYPPPMDCYRPPMERPPMMGPPPYQQPMIRRGGPPPVAEEPPGESAWERGLRQAKEMLRRSTKRKETDADFEEKKMTLGLQGQEEYDKENDYYPRPSSPIYDDYHERNKEGGGGGGGGTGEKRYRSVSDRFGDYPPPSGYYRDGYYEDRGSHYHRSSRHHQGRDYRGASDDYYDSERNRKKKYSSREVVVGRGEKGYKDASPPSGRSRGPRGDEWADPWMRSKSPSRKGTARKKSYSSRSRSSSYSSSSSSSRSSYSSYSRSRSRSSISRSTSRSRSRSSFSRKKLSPLSRRAKSPFSRDRRIGEPDRGLHMNPPPPSPGRLSPRRNPTPPSAADRANRNIRLIAAAMRDRSSVSSRSSSGSESSGSSSDSSSDSGSSSSSSSPVRHKPSLQNRKEIELNKKIVSKAMDAFKLKGEKQNIRLNLKPGSSISERLAAPLSRKRPAPDSGGSGDEDSSPGMGKKKTAPSRREELLKQLKAVEDAIARKRSKN